MAASSALLLLPPRHTAQGPRDSLKNSSSSSDSDSFAPKLEKARKHHQSKKTAPVVSTPTRAVTKTVAKPAAAKIGPDETPLEKDDEETSTAANQAKKIVKPAVDEDDAAPEEHASEADHPSGAKAAAIAQTTTPLEKKPVKASKPTAPKANTASQGLLVNQAKTEDAASSTDAADSADDATATEVSSVGDGFYGSGKVIARADANGESTQDSDAAVSDSSNANAAATDPLATAEAEIASATAVSNATGTAAAAESAATPEPSTAEQSTAASAALLGALGTAAGTTLNAPAIGHAQTAVAESPQAKFVDQNHPTIVSSITGQLMPKGGTMHIRLDPPELGALQVTVHVKDGVMTASFQTASDDATKLLTRSLGQLKSGLEAAGMSVEKLHVELAPKNSSNNQTDDQSSSKQSAQQQQQKQDQQRREMVQRMWRKLSGADPLDLVA
jgi:hypothetical protein